MSEERKEFTPIHGQFPDKDKIACKDCAFRDKTIVTIIGKTIQAGITKGNCEMYELKPHDVLFQNAPCQFYSKETKATG